MTSGVTGRWHRAAKRALDLVVAVPLALLTTPLLVVLSLASAIAFRANPFFTQPRLGLRGEEFWFVKIRSLPPSAPASADKYEIAEIRDRGVGRFVRAFHLDELPQLWLVIGGSMSLVGPRPEMPELAARFDPVFVKERTAVKPGCTGLWQISTASAGLIGDAPEFDVHYVHHATLRLDVWVLLYTAKVLGGGRPISGLEQIPSLTGARPPSRAD